MWIDYWWSSGRWPGPWMFFGPIMMIIFMIICAAVMFYMMRGRMMRHTGREHPVDILKERFARGEINQTEYEHQRRLLDY